MAEQWLAILEARLDELDVDSLTIAAFIGIYNESDDAERARFKAMGDRALIRFCRNLPAARHAAAEVSQSEVESQAFEVIERPVRDVLAWVGDDVERARMALELEDVSTNPRRSLRETLERMISAPAV